MLARHISKFYRPKSSSEAHLPKRHSFLHLLRNEQALDDPNRKRIYLLTEIRRNEQLN